MTLDVGRVGLDVDLGHPTETTHRATFDGGVETLFRGFINTSLANAKYLRSELLQQQGQLVAIRYSFDDTFDGYYLLAESRIDTTPLSYRAGIMPYEIAALRYGSDADVMLQSNLTGNTVTNAHSVTPTPWIAFPPGTLAVDVGSDSPTEFERTGEDGDMNVLINLDRDSDPTWSVTPANYYQGSAKILTEGLVRAGRGLPRNDPADWSLENGFIRMRPSAYQSTSDGELDFYWHNGTSWSTTPISFRIDWDGTDAITEWHYMTVLLNTPEQVTIRLVRDANTSPPGAHQHQLDCTLRRGAPYIAFYYKYAGSDLQHEVSRTATDAATSATGYITDSDTSDGNKWILGSPQSQTQDTTNGRIRASIASEFFKFYIASDIGNNGTGNDAPAAIQQQYHGWVSESVRAVRR